MSISSASTGAARSLMIDRNSINESLPLALLSSFREHTSLHRSSKGLKVTLRATSSIEWLLRCRRTVMFAGSSGLISVPKLEKRDRDLSARIRDTVLLDHCSIWKSKSGTKFFLNEPYGSNAMPTAKALLDVGLIAIEVPVPLSPYAGGFSEVAGSLPFTRSYVIGDKAADEELKKISVRLHSASQSAPAWNDVSEVRYG